MIDWYYRRQRRPLLDYLIHLGLYDAAFDETGILQRYATPLVERYRQHIFAVESRMRNLSSIGNYDQTHYCHR